MPQQIDMDSSLDAWSRYLRADPTWWLLGDDAPPSIHLWYALDIANRPENAPVVIELQDRVLFSDTVQAIFGLQQPEGYWETPHSLVEPRYRATVWNLALLAELGIPHTSRRARMAVEFALQGDFPGGPELAKSHPMALAHFIRAARYFGYANDERVLTLASLLSFDSFEPALAWLWSFGIRSSAPPDYSIAANIVLARLAEGGLSPLLTFPHFEMVDILFILRVLACYQVADDDRAHQLFAKLVSQQDDKGRWSLDLNLNDKLNVPFPDATRPSYWATLNALRIMKSLVLA